MRTLVDEFERIHKEFGEALLGCRVNASAKAVHRLRKIIRMSEAVLRKAGEDHPHAAKLHKRIQQTVKQLKLVRRAAGPVRDLDVHRKLAAKMRDRMLQSTQSGVHTKLRSEFESLDARLSKRRKRAENELKQMLVTRELKLESALQKFAKALQNLHNGEPEVLATAKKWVQQTPLPGEDPESLHGYRKKTKAARYLAGMDEGSAAARKLEKRLKQVQDAIGKWHDLLLLAEEAKDALGDHAVITLAVIRAREQAHMRAERKIRLNSETGWIL